MTKKIWGKCGFLFLLFLAIMMCSCDAGKGEIILSTDEKSNEDVETAPNNVPTAPESSQATVMRIQTELDYTQDTSLPVGDVGEIVVESGIIRESAYNVFLENGGWVLGADKERNILVIDGLSFHIETISPEGISTILTENIMESRGKNIEAAAWDGGNYVVWAESPNAGVYYDETYGADWAVYLINLQTGEETKIDEDGGLRVSLDMPYHYLAPTHVAIGDGYVAYISFEENQEGNVVQTIMLYEIATGQLTELDYLNGDPAENGMGWASIGDGKVSWSQAYIRSEDHLYEGYTSVYDFATKTESIIETTENVINPVLVGHRLIGENNPNMTYYDSEIVVYDFVQNQWIYKVAPSYPDYAKRSLEGVNLGGITCSGNYATWTGNILTNVLVMDVTNGSLYTITENQYDIFGISLYPGNLLLWSERYFNESGELLARLCYAFLSET